MGDFIERFLLVEQIKLLKVIAWLIDASVIIMNPKPEFLNVKGSAYCLNIHIKQRIFRH